MARSPHHFLATSSLNPILITFMAMLNLHANSSQLAARSLPAANIKTPSLPPPNIAELFVRSACSSTTYPRLCIRSLSSYSTRINRSPMLLAHAALSISLDGARSASAAMKSMPAAGRREAGAMRDCLENIGDSIDELRDSLSEMRNLRVGKDMSYQMNSIQTWVSAALTDDDSCMDGFGGGLVDEGVMAAVRRRVVDAAHLTSNALALINGVAVSTGHYFSADAAP